MSMMSMMSNSSKHERYSSTRTGTGLGHVYNVQAIVVPKKNCSIMNTRIGLGHV